MDDELRRHAYRRRDVLKAAAIAGAAVALLEQFPASAFEKPQDFQKGSVMPLARIDISKDASPELVKIVGEAIYKAMVDVANVPVHDKFQVVHRHQADEIIYPQEGYLGLSYTKDLIIIQVTWVKGRSVEVKKRFFQQIATDIHEKGGVRKEDVWISLVESSREDWSFGNGEMQYAPAD